MSAFDQFANKSLCNSLKNKQPRKILARFVRFFKFFFIFFLFFSLDLRSVSISSTNLEGLEARDNSSGNGNESRSKGELLSYDLGIHHFLRRWGRWRDVSTQKRQYQH